MRSERAAVWRLALAAQAVAMLVGVVALLVSDAWRAGFSGADEPAHFLNAYFIALYERVALATNPLAFATEFYLHYPKISIGHWPPAYYAALSPLLLVAPPTPATAFAINLVAAAAPAALLAPLLARVASWRIALLGALLCALTPVALEGQAFFMLDQPLAALALAATMVWIDYVARPVWWRVIAFALLAAGAVLVKGNGWLLLFVPPLHLLLTGRWPVLASPWPWAAALLAALLVGPWYWLTAGISADGFNYEPGPAYAWRALRYNADALAANLSLPGVLIAGYGLYAEWRRRAEDPARWSVVAGCASLVAAVLLLQSLVPVALDPRYLAPALPPAVLLALLGARALAVRLRLAARPLVLLAATLALAAPGLLHLARREPKIDLRLVEAAAVARPGSAWLIDGGSGAEGAFIAALAVRDPDLAGYAVRASQLLAESDFMGDEYRLAAASPAAILARLGALGIEGVVVTRIGGEPAFPHSALLRAALNGPGSRYRRAYALAHRNRAGVTEIYIAGPRPPNARALRALGLPDKAATLAR